MTKGISAEAGVRLDNFDTWGETRVCGRTGMSLRVPFLSSSSLREGRVAGGEGAGPRVEAWGVPLNSSGAQRRRQRARGAQLGSGAAAGVLLRFPTVCTATTSSGWTPSSAQPSSSWHSRSSSAKHAKAFQANDGLCYLRSFFDPWTFNEIREETTRLRPFLRRERNGTAVDRMGMYLKVSGTP